MEKRRGARRAAGATGSVGGRKGAELAERPNVLYYGDNLEVLRRYIDDEAVDLIYLDPPFQSGREHNVFFNTDAQKLAFSDTWKWDEAAAAAYDEVLKTGKPVALVLEAFHRFLMDAAGGSTIMAYMAMMAIRLTELHRVLKPTGSLYLHCDTTASHYLKITLDAIFGVEKFNSEVIWKRSSAHSGSKRYSPVHDTILFYSKGDRHTWNPILTPISQQTEDNWYNNEDGDGHRFYRADLTAPGVRSGASGDPWRGKNPTDKGRHWAIPGYVREEFSDLPSETQDALDALDKAGRIHWPKKANGMPRFKRYIEESAGVPALDVITDIPPLNNVDAERLGYPTQKPLTLLERIITSSSNDNDLVLDPFCGCGTTVEAAQKLNRRWIGIDITHVAIGKIRTRLQESFGEAVMRSYSVVGEPTDLDGANQLALEDRFQFEQWALGLVGARTDTKTKGADKGIDGALVFSEPGTASKTERILFSVKSGKTSSRDVRDLRGVVEREKCAIGVLITLQAPTRDMKAEAAEAGVFSCVSGRYPRLQIITIEDLLAGKRIDAPVMTGRKPAKVAPKQRELQFTKSG